MYKMFYVVCPGMSLICRRLLLVSLAPTATRKKLSIGFHLLLLQQCEYQSWLQQGLQTSFLRTTTVASRMDFPILTPLPLVTNILPNAVEAICSMQDTWYLDLNK
jgi:hypothetical protein